MKKSRRSQSYLLQNRSSLWEVEDLRATLPEACPIAFNHIFHAGGIVTQHVHDCLEIGYCRQGAGVFLAGQKLLRYQAGDVMVVNEREAHGFYNPTDEASEWNFLFLDPVRLLPGIGTEVQVLSTAEFCGAGFSNCMSSHEHPQVAAWVREILEELQTTPAHHQSAVRALVWRLLVELHRLTPPDMGTNTPSSPETIRRLEPVLSHISKHLDEALPLEELARIGHVSVATLRRQFVAAMGESPQAYLLRLRIQTAMALLQGTELSVLEISLRVGFPTLSGLYRQFRRITGTTPAAWRRGCVPHSQCRCEPHGQ